MSNTVKRTVYLPLSVAEAARQRAQAEGKTLSSFVREAVQRQLADARTRRRLNELRAIQGYWSAKARAKGILTEADLERYLRE